MRFRILEALVVADSAAGVARRLGVARQNVNYHLHELEREGLVQLVEERKNRNCVERIVKATDRSYLVGTAAFTALAPQTSESAADRFSPAFLVAASAQTITDVAEFQSRQDVSERSLPTFTIDTKVKLSDAADFSAFFSELAEALSNVLTKHRDANTPEAQTFRLVVGAHPSTDKK